MDSVKVAIRIRPLIAREQGSEILWTADTHQVRLKEGKGKPYVFDRVFDSDEITSDVYEEIVEPIVQSAMGGFNGTVFAYGQTSSGKTYTMMGDRQNPGIIPLSVKETFEHIQKTPEREFLFRVSYMEIYNEVVRDLLSPSSDGPGLQIREDEFRNAVVQGLTEKLVVSPEEVLKLMETGDRRRHTGCTNMNERSSRSHTIFRMIIESRERIDANTTRDSMDSDSAVKVSQLNLVDLAGSERASQTGAEGQRFKEGCHINKSLSTLGLVINQICKASESGQSAPFISYRDSKLTRILQPSLGGNSLTAIICAVTPVSADDTDSTLRFASNAKKIKNKPHVNEVLSDEALLYRQKREINQLKKKIQELELNAGKKQTEELETLLEEKDKLRKEQEERIQMLKKIILVSTHPADSMKRQRAIRRETWCPGKHAVANRSPQPWRSPRIDTTLVNQSRFFQKLDQTLMGSDFEPVASKRARFMDDPVTSNFSLALTPGTKQRADDASRNFVSLEEEVIQMRKQQEELEEELEKVKASKSKVIQEKESLNMKMMKMQGQISAQCETLDEVLEEKNQLEEEKENLQSKVKDQNQRISEYMRREKQWENANPDVRALKNENMDLCDQLREVCAQNRKLQENNDEDRDTLDFLQSTLDEVTRDTKQKEASLEEYKQQVTVLQSQLEMSSTSNHTHSPTALQDVHRLEEELKASKEDLEKRKAKVEEQTLEILKLQSQLEDTKRNSESGGDDVNEILESLEQQMQENHKLKIQLDELKITRDDHKDSQEMELLSQDVKHLQEEVAGKDAEIANLKKLVEEKTLVIDKTMDESVKVGEKTFADYISACEALLEQKEAAQNELESLKDEMEKLRGELDELKSSGMNESVKFGEKSMMDALTACEVITEERDLANEECEKLKHQLELLATERDQIKQDLLAMKEHDEFVQAEKDVLFEQEKEYLAEIEALRQQLEEQKAELEKPKTSDPGKLIVSADPKVHDLREEINNLLKSSADAQEMLQEANKDLAISNSTVESQRVKIEELEKELKRVKSDVESFDTMAEMTKQKYDRRIEELTQQLQSAYDQLGDGQGNSGDRNGSNFESAIEEYKILLDQKETEIKNLTEKIESSFTRMEEMQGTVDGYKKKLEELTESRSHGLQPGQNFQLVDIQNFMTERKISLDDIKQKLDVVDSLEEEKKKIALDFQQASQRILELEESVRRSKDEMECLEELKAKISELEREISERDTALEELKAGSVETSLSSKLQEDLDALQISLQEKESELASLSTKMSEMESQNAEKDDAIRRLDLNLTLSRGKQEELERQLEDSVIVSSNEDEKNLREMLANTRKELSDMKERYTKLQSVTEHAQGALLAETNRDLDQQRLLQLAEKQRRESELEIASERQSANKQINQLLTKVNDLQTSLCKANVDKDVAQRQSDKMTQECEFLRQQVKELENIHHKEVSVIPRGQAMDPDKMAIKIKQLTLNLELTKQTSDKLTTTNKKLQDENKKMESEMVRVLNLQGEVTRLSAILDHERKMREDDAARQNMRDKESSEMRQKIIDLQNRLKEMENDLQKQESEAADVLKTSSHEKKILEDELGFLKEKLSSLDAVIRTLRQKEEESEKMTQESQSKLESMLSELDNERSVRMQDKKMIESLEERLNHAVKILEQEKEKSSEIENQKQDLITNLDRMQGSLDEKESLLKEAQTGSELLQQSLEEVKMKLESAGEELKDVETKIMDHEKTKREELEKNLEELKVRLKESYEERDSLQQKLRDNQVNTETRKQLQEEHNIIIKERDSLRACLTDMEKVSQEKDAKFSELMDSFQESEENLGKVKLDNDSLRGRLEEIEEKSKILRKNLEEMRKSDCQIEGEVDYKMLQEQHNILSQERDSLLDRIRELEVSIALKEEEGVNALPKEEDPAKIAELEEKIADLEAELEDVILAKEEACRMLDEARENHKNAVVEVQEDVSKKEEEIKLLEDAAYQGSSLLQEERDSLKQHLDEKEEELKKYMSLVKDLQDKCSSLEETIARRNASEKDDDGIGFAASLDQKIIESLQDQVAELKLELEDKEEQIEDLKRTVDSLKTGSVPRVSSIDVDATKLLQDELRNLNGRVEELSSVIVAKDAEIQSLLQSDENPTSSSTEVILELSKLKEENANLNERICEFQTSSMSFNELEDLQRKLEETSSLLEAKEKKILELDQLTKDLQSRVSEVSSEGDEMEESDAKILGLNQLKSIQIVSSSPEETMLELSRLKEENANLNERICELETSSVNIDELNDLQKKLRETSFLLEEKEARIHELNQLTEDFQSKISDLASKEEEKKEKDAKISDRDEEIRILVRKREEDKVKISELKSHLLSENEEMAEMKQQLLDLGKTLEREDSRMVELKKMKEDAEAQLGKSKEEYKILLKKMEERGAESDKLTEENKNLNTLITKLKDEVSDAKSKLEENVSTFQQRIADLEKRLEKSTMECERLSEELSHLHEEKEDLERRKCDLKNKLEESRSREDDEDSKGLRITELEADLNLYKEKASSLDEQLNSVYEMIQEKAALMEESATSREEMEKNLETLRLENSNLKDQLREWEERGLAASTDLVEGAKKTEERIRQLVNEVTALTGSKDSLASEIDQVKQENSTLENEIQGAVNRIQELEQEAIDLKDERDSLRHDRENLMSERDELKNRMANEQENIENLGSKVASLSSLKDSLEKELDDVKEQKTSVEEKVADLQLSIKEHREMMEELGSAKISLESLLEEKKTLLREVGELREKMENLTKLQKKEIDAIKSSHSRELSEVGKLKEKMVLDQKDAEKNLEETRGLLYKKELEVQSLESEVSKWERRYEEHKSAFDNAVKTTKEEIASLNEKHSLEVYGLEEKLEKLQKNEKDLQKKMEALSTEQGEQENLRIEIEREKEESKKLGEKIATLESEFATKLKEAKEKAKADQNRLLQKIDSLEDGLFESDKELEEEKKRYEELKKKLKQMEEKHERAGATRTRGSEKNANDLEELKESCSKAEIKYKEEKQRNQQLAAQLKTEKRRCAELVARLENMAVKQRSKFPGVDTSDTAKELFMEQEKNKELSLKLSGCEADFSKRMEEVQEKMRTTKKNLAARINELEDNCIESETELEEEKKKTENLENKLKILEQKLKSKTSSGSGNSDGNLRRKVEEKENQISRLEIQLKSNVEPLEREISQLKEELKMSEERVSSLKQQLKFLPSTAEGPTRNTASSGRTTRSSAAAGKSLRGGSGGLVVQDTKVYVLEMEISDKQMRIKYLEKELAKYKDIETKRRAENMELLEENKKYRTIIKKVREKKHSSADVLSENSSTLNQPTPPSGARHKDELPSVHANQEDNCKNQ